MAQFIICTSGGGNFLRRFDSWQEAFNHAIEYLGYDGNEHRPAADYISLDDEHGWTIKAENRLLTDDGRIIRRDLIPTLCEWISDEDYEVTGTDGRLYETG